MPDSNTLESPLQSAAGSAGPQVIDAFELLSHEIRLSILLALWETYDPYGSNEPVTFSELYDSVAISDSANFTYHLDKLTDRFVEKTADGYGLRNAGLLIVRAIIAGAGLEKPVVSSTESGISCHRCGDGRVEISYHDEAVYLTCPECEGFMPAEEHPRGTIAKFWLDPAGLANRQPLELLAASVIRTENRNRMMKQGVCPACSGPIETSLQLCEEHTPGPREVCSNCGTQDSVRVRYVCSVCKNRNRRPVELTVIDHPDFIAFYDDHDIDLRWDIDDGYECIRLMEYMWAMEHSLDSTDPVRIRITVPCDGDELQLKLNEDLDIIEATRST
jgi:DNA-binding transcriptional ArsR family regulator